MQDSQDFFDLRNLVNPDNPVILSKNPRVIQIYIPVRSAGGAVLSSRVAPHPHPLRHAASAAYARLASSRFASLARSALRALESPRQGGVTPTPPL